MSDYKVLVPVPIAADVIFTVSYISKGPFDMTLNSFGVCVGPKNKDCTNFNARIIARNVIFMDMKVTTSVSPSKVIKSIIFIFLVWPLKA